MKLRYILILLAALGISGFAWIRQHDELVKIRALAEARSDSLDKAADITDRMRKAVVSLDSAYAARTWEYHKQLAAMNHKRDSLSSEITRLADMIKLALPDSAKHLGPEIAEVCKQQADVIYSALVVCESLRKQAIEQVARRDTLNVRLQGERDGYRKLYTTLLDSKGVREPVWAFVGKATATAGVLAVVAKLLGIY